VIALGIYLAYYFGSTSTAVESGIYGIAVAAVAMLSTTGMVIAVDYVPGRLLVFEEIRSFDDLRRAMRAGER
jgi:hypothetical protein